MSKKKEHILLKINALIVALLGLLGCSSCSYYVKYGVPDFPYNDTTGIDTLVHVMYGVMPVEKYGVPGTEWAPQRVPEEPQREPRQAPEEESK